MIITVTKPTVIATVGLPASGKTTWADEQIRKDETGHLTIVNRDLIRDMLRRPFGEDEGLVTDVQHAAIRACLRAGKSVIVDDTNLNPVHLADLQAFAMNQTLTFNLVQHFLFVTPAECVSRDANRPDHEQVGSGVILGLYEKWRHQWPQMDGWQDSAEIRVDGDQCAG